MRGHGTGMGRGLAPPAFLALSLLALAILPLAAAETGVGPWDATGPTVEAITIDPNPVVPDLVRVTGVATDLSSPIVLAEFWIDAPGPSGESFFRIRPADGAFDSTTEGLRWIGTFFAFTQGIAPGLHVLNVHAFDFDGTWGPYASIDFIVGDPATTGPFVTALTASPEDLALGTALSLEGVVDDPFDEAILAAEFFLDRQGPDGTGTPLDPFDGAWGDPLEVVTGTGAPSLPPGRHTVYAHGMNDRLVWGPPATATLTVRAPVLTFALLVDPIEAGPGETVTHTVTVANRGNAEATEAWIDLPLPASLGYVEDTSAAAGGAPVGPDRWRFTNVSASGFSFAIRSQVRVGSTDGLELGTAATLDYTNGVGWDFAPVIAIAVGSVIAPELDMTITVPAIAFAAETFDLIIDLRHTGIRRIPQVEIAADLGSWATPVGDNAATLGGERVEGLWRFHDLAPGIHRFVVTVRVDPDAVDLVIAPMGVTVQFLSRAGSPIFLQESPSVRVSRPSLEVTAEADRLEFLAGGQVTFVVEYANRGSATARDVEVQVTLPDGMALLGGDVPAASSGPQHTWRFSDVASGGSGRFTVVVLGTREGTTDVRFELAYTSPGGVFLARVTASETLTVRPVPLPQTPPIAPIALAGTSLALIGFVATERGKTALTFLLFLPLYTRLRHEKVLDHETRGMIRGYIVANPGDHYNSIKEALELPNGTLAYHIQVLQKEMIVRSVKDGKFRRFYPAEMRIPLGGEPTKIQRVILDLIRTNPGITPRDAAGLLGLTSSTVSYHLEKLEEHGRIEYRREGITKRLYVQGDLDES